MNKRFCIFTLAFALPAILYAAQDDSATAKDESSAGKDTERLVGEYEIVEGAKDGAKIPAERLKNNTVAITRDTIAVVDPDRKELYSARYKLGPENDEGVAQINMRSKSPKEGANAVGLLKRDGEQLWLIYDISNKRPENFEKTTEGQHLFKMKRKQATKPEPTE